MEKNSTVKLIGGLISGMLIGGVTVVGANQAIQAMQNTEIKVSLNGQIQEFKDETTGEIQYPITYHDRTYLPLRNVAQLSGLNVDYDNTNNIAILKTNNSNESIIKFGKYEIGPGVVESETFSYDGVGITLDENNLCSIFEGYGRSFVGTYKIESNKLICNTVFIRGEEGGISLQECNIVFIFEIVDNNSLKLNTINNMSNISVDDKGLKSGMIYKYNPNSHTKVLIEGNVAHVAN